MLGLGYGASGRAAEVLAAEITSAGGRAIAVGADLRRPQAPGELVQASPKRWVRWMCWSATPG